MNNFIHISSPSLSALAENAKGQIHAIFLHWTAGRYDQKFSDYHLCIDGDGQVYSSCFNLLDKKAHTWHRNTGSIGIALCCALGATISRSRSEHITCEAHIASPSGDISPWKVDFGDFPPTIAQIQSMAYAVACICFHADLPINASTVITHAEIAKVDNYGIESDDPEKKWDLLVLPGTAISGGDYIRSLAKACLAKLKRDREKLSLELAKQ